MKKISKINKFATIVAFIILTLIISLLGSKTKVTCTLGEICSQLTNTEVNFSDAPIDVTELFDLSPKKIRFENLNSKIIVLDHSSSNELNGCEHRVLLITDVLYRQFFFIPVSEEFVSLEFCTSENKWKLISAKLDTIGL